SFSTLSPLLVNTFANENFNGVVGSIVPLASLATDQDENVPVGGHVVFNAIGSNLIPTVTTNGKQAYNDAVILGKSAVLASVGGGNVAFNSTVDSSSPLAPNALTVNTAGVTMFGDAVGNDFVG